MKYKQGFYIPKNPQKCRISKLSLNKEILPKYRSSYELQFFKFCDLNEYVSEWSSEPFPIKYFNPIKKKICNYYIDFYMIFKGIKYLIEIKPKSQTKEGKNLYEKLTYCVNSAKWEAAKKFCKENNMIFMILTEDQLFNTKFK